MSIVVINGKFIITTVVRLERVCANSLIEQYLTSGAAVVCFEHRVHKLSYCWNGDCHGMQCVKISDSIHDAYKVLVLQKL